MAWALIALTRFTHDGRQRVVPRHAWLIAANATLDLVQHDLSAFDRSTDASHAPQVAIDQSLLAVRTRADGSPVTTLYTLAEDGDLHRDITPTSPGAAIAAFDPASTNTAPPLLGRVTSFTVAFERVEPPEPPEPPANNTTTPQLGVLTVTIVAALESGAVQAHRAYIIEPPTRPRPTESRP